MRAGEKLGLKHALIKTGFWSDQEPSDPVSNEKAAALLLQRIEERLGDNVALFFQKAGEHSLLNEVRVNWRQMTSVLAREENLSVAICKAAVALPAFLERHPECAAAQTYSHKS